MKVRESSMPVEEQWDSFFKPQAILKRLGLSKSTKDVADFGSGYGTFAIPAAQMISGRVYALDIEPLMVETVQSKIEELGLNNVSSILRDFVSEGSGLSDCSVDFVFLFNILHQEEPVSLLEEAYRILNPNGKVVIIHWKYDPNTPRGPPLNMRPKPEQIRKWAEVAGFTFQKQLYLKPYHYALILMKKVLM